MHERGASLRELSEAFGISRERVRQILKKAGIVRTWQEAGEARRARLGPADAAEVVRRIKEGISPRAIAGDLGVPYKAVERVVRTIPNRRIYTRARWRPRYGDQEIRSCVEEAARRVDGVLTGDVYDEIARRESLPSGRGWPLSQTVAKRFGSWSAALQEIGVPGNPPSPVAGKRAFDRDDCVAAVREAQERLGHAPSALEYQGLAKRFWLPSVATVQSRCGSWMEAVRLANEDE